jgi:glycerol-3-phosphate dehydrogenase (NAD(P)+)
VIANIIARNNRKVLLYVRDEKVIHRILEKRDNRGHKMHKNILPTDDMAYLADQCEVIFPIVPSEHFRAMMKKLAPHLHPYHILIHGTKGFDIKLNKGESIESVPTANRVPPYRHAPAGPAHPRVPQTRELLLQYRACVD